MIESFEPRYRSFRFTVELPGVDAFCITYVRQVTEDSIEIGFTSMNNTVDIDKCPVLDQPDQMNLMLLDSSGKTIKRALVTYKHVEWLPIDLRYDNSSPLICRIILKRADVLWL